MCILEVGDLALIYFMAPFFQLLYSLALGGVFFLGKCIPLIIFYDHGGVLDEHVVIQSIILAKLSPFHFTHTFEFAF